MMTSTAPEGLTLPVLTTDWTGRASRNVRGIVAAVVLAVYVVLGIAGRWIEPRNPNSIDPAAILSGPSTSHWFGTDDLGRDILSRVIDAVWIALVAAVGASLVALIVGTVLGTLAGFRGGRTDDVIDWLFNIVFSFPALLLAIIVVGALGPNVYTATVAIGVVYIPRVGRLARTATRTVRGTHYIEAARLSGMPDRQILVRHVLPNIAAPLIVITAVHMSEAQLAYSSLSFLGLGARPPQADYGSMLASARDFMTTDPWIMAFPASALVLLIVALNVFGDLVRDRLDPQR
jgi:peptide/nickel transport system permease protein